jgi:hypothetical protein
LHALGTARADAREGDIGMQLGDAAAFSRKTKSSDPTPGRGHPCWFEQTTIAVGKDN